MIYGINMIYGLNIMYGINCKRIHSLPLMHLWIYCDWFYTKMNHSVIKAGRTFFSFFFQIWQNYFHEHCPCQLNKTACWVPLPSFLNKVNSCFKNTIPWNDTFHSFYCYFTALYFVFTHCYFFGFLGFFSRIDLLQTTFWKHYHIY